MKRLLLLLVLGTSFHFIAFAQNTFNYSVEINPITFPGIPGLHSYAYAQHQGKWLILGGRLDGLHARQPFNAFPASNNNNEIFVMDVINQSFWNVSLTSLPVGLQEQLQGTNLNFYQDGDTLFVIGGYAYSNSIGDHITFPNLTSVDVPGLINAIINNQTITPYFKQITDDVFAVTGAQLGKIGANYYLVGGHRFDGRYNPMNMPTYVQEYTDGIRKFQIDNSGNQLSYSDYSELQDPVHLHRRDYNLMPQIDSAGEFGYFLSSGVFQVDQDLPFLYPVDISESTIEPHTEFNQYLSNYHSASSSLFDADLNEMHFLFFGGMSQYYYSNGNLVQDNNVPFVKTVSLVTRHQDGSLEEFVLPIEMPILTGSSAEFIPNESLPMAGNDIISLSGINEESFVIGHIYGGIESPLLNPFASNQTTQTTAANVVYEVRLIRETMDLEPVNGTNPFSLTISPNPVQEVIQFQLNQIPENSLYFFLTDLKGSIIMEGYLDETKKVQQIKLPSQISKQALWLTLSIDHQFYVDKMIMVAE